MYQRHIVYEITYSVSLDEVTASFLLVKEAVVVPLDVTWFLQDANVTEDVISRKLENVCVDHNLFTFVFQNLSVIKNITVTLSSIY